MLAPHLRHISRVNQVHLYAQRIAAPVDSACEHRSNVQLTGDLARISFMALVVEHNTARHDTEFWQLRKIVDQAFGDFVAEVFGVGIRGFVDERENGYRFDYAAGAIDGFAASREVSDSSGCQDKRYQGSQ